MDHYHAALNALQPLKTLIGVPVEVQIVTDQGELRSICGIVAEARQGESDGGLSTYQLVMRDALAILDLSVKVRLASMREDDHVHTEGAGASGSERDSAWVRVASGWSGTGDGRHFGTLALPRPGTEVLIAFLGGDPDKPVIIGQLYNMIARPPSWAPAICRATNTCRA